MYYRIGDDVQVYGGRIGRVVGKLEKAERYLIEYENGGWDLLSPNYLSYHPDEEEGGSGMSEVTLGTEFEYTWNTEPPYVDRGIIRFIYDDHVWIEWSGNDGVKHSVWKIQEVKECLIPADPKHELALSVVENLDANFLDGKLYWHEKNALYSLVYDALTQYDEDRQ